MARHDHRDRVSGKFTKVDPQRDLAPANVSGAPSKYTQDIKRHGPSADGESEPARQPCPVQVSGQDGERLFSHIESDLDRAGRKRAIHQAAAGEHDAISYLVTGR